MRVITGSARGRRLITADGREVRPTPERVKEGLFSAIQFDLEDRTVLDLFAGSGQLGIEALSRGAKRAVFVDSSQDSCNLVTKNLETTQLLNRARVVCMEYSAAILGFSEKFDFVFLDPPYNSGLLIPAIEKVQCCVGKYGRIICEHPSDQKLEQIIGDFKLKKHYKYGKVCISIYERDGERSE